MRSDVNPGVIGSPSYLKPSWVAPGGRDFAAWLGLVRLQRSTGGKQRLGKTSKMGQRDIRRLLIIGAMAVVRWASRKGAPGGSWLARMMAKKPRILVGHCAGQQDGAWHLGHADKGGGLPESGNGACMSIQQHT